MDYRSVMGVVLRGHLILEGTTKMFPDSVTSIEAIEDEIGLLEDAIDSALCIYDYTDEESDELCRLLNKLDNYFKFEGRPKTHLQHQMMRCELRELILQKNTDMFKKFSIDFNVEHMMCVPFENAPMEVKTFCVSELQCDVNNETFAIYCLVNNIPITLGYFQFDDSNIVESKHFESMINFTESFNNNLTSRKDYERFKNRNCKCIKQWFFDDKLRNVNLLEIIFDYIITYVDTIKKCDMLWFDGINSIVFYPIEKNDCISRYAKIKSHFVTEFIKL